MASPFTADIIPIRPARPMQGRGTPPGSGSARFPVATRRYLRHMDADAIARLLDGTDYGEPEIVRRQREFAPISDRRLGWLIAVGVSVLTWGVLGACVLLIVSGTL